jgi:catalase
MTLSVQGVGIPDSKLAREITELVRDTASPLLFHHSSRVYYFGALAGKQQPGDLFRKMNAAQRQALFDNTTRQIRASAKHIHERHITNCTKADPAYGAGIAQAIARLV